MIKVGKKKKLLPCLNYKQTNKQEMIQYNVGVLFILYKDQALFLLMTFEAEFSCLVDLIYLKVLPEK